MSSHDKSADFSPLDPQFDLTSTDLSGIPDENLSYWEDSSNLLGEPAVPATPLSELNAASDFSSSGLTDFNSQQWEQPSAGFESQTGEGVDWSPEVKFGSAGSCWWCHGSGVYWSGGENQTCPKCGGSGIGAT